MGLEKVPHVVFRDGPGGEILRFEAEKSALLGPRKWQVFEADETSYRQIGGLMAHHNCLNNVRCEKHESKYPSAIAS